MSSGRLGWSIRSRPQDGGFFWVWSSVTRVSWTTEATRESAASCLACLSFGPDRIAVEDRAVGVAYFRPVLLGEAFSGRRRSLRSPLECHQVTSADGTGLSGAEYPPLRCGVRGQGDGRKRRGTGHRGQAPRPAQTPRSRPCHGLSSPPQLGVRQPRVRRVHPALGRYATWQPLVRREGPQGGLRGRNRPYRPWRMREGCADFRTVYECVLLWTCRGCGALGTATVEGDDEAHTVVRPPSDTRRGGNVKAIRRFTVRPVLPEPLRPLSDLARNLRWSWHTETRELFQAVDPERWAASDGDPVRLLGGVSRRAARRAGRGPAASCAGSPRSPTTCGEYVDRRPLVPDPAPGRGTARRHRLLLARVRHHRRPAAVLRRPRHPRRRPSEGGQRPRRTAHRRRPALPARLLPPVACPGTAGSRSTTPSSTPTSCRSTLLREADGTPAQVVARPARRPLAARPRLAGPGRPRPAAAARLRRRGERPRRTRASPTGSTAAAASTGCSRRCCSASAGCAPCGRTAG